MAQRGKLKRLLVMTKTLLIDFDGTLVQQKAGLKGHFLLHGLARLRGQCSLLGALRAAIKIHRELPKSSGLFSIRQLSEQIFGDYTGLRPATYHDMCRHALYHSQHHRLTAGALSFIQWAKERYRLILATSPIFSKSVLEERLIWAGLNPRDFWALTSSDSFHWIKPQVNYFKQILDLYSLSPNDCLMIGNDRIKDLPARDCGIPLVLLGPHASPSGVQGFQGFASLQKWMEVQA